MTDEINRWKVGNVKITRVVEMEAGFPPGAMFNGLTEDRVKAIDWIHPHYALPDGTVKYSVHAYVVESQGHRIIVDTCIGNDKPRNNEGWSKLQIPFLDRLKKAGYTPESIDTVLCTHLHLDHVGWNTRWDGKKWVPTFPNARYLFGRTEWEHWTKNQGTGDMPDFVVQLSEQGNVMNDSVLPIVKAGLQELVETNYRVTDEVSLFPTPGHTPGHVSVAISSAGQKATITGDVMHNPIQIEDPEICANFDFDQGVALKTRRAFINDHENKKVLVLGTHFPSPNAGHIVTEKGGRRFIPAKEQADETVQNQQGDLDVARRVRVERYEGKRAVIIGGTSGIGLATAKMLLDGGARVLVTGRSKAGLESAQKELGKGGFVVSSDARSLTEIDALASRVKAEFDTFDLLFVNAGFGIFAPFENTTESIYDEMFNLG